MNDDIEAMIEDCLNRKKKMNTWEAEFIESIALNEPEKLTGKQIQRLEIIWDKVTS